MKQRYGKSFFEEVEKLEFKKLIRIFEISIRDVDLLLKSCMSKLERGKMPSKNHLARIRAVSHNLDKVAKIYRKRTLEMQKPEKESTEEPFRLV